MLVRRIDDGNWELPGGRIEVGETAATTVVREVAEESGITIELTGSPGSTAIPAMSWSTPTTPSTNNSHCASTPFPPPMTANSHGRTDRNRRRQLAHPADIDNLNIHPAMRLRLDNAVTAPRHTHYD